MRLRKLDLVLMLAAAALWGALVVGSCTPAERIETSLDALVCIEKTVADRLLVEMRDAGGDRE